MDAQHPQLHELAADISRFQNLLLSLPRSHPLRVYYVQSLATAQFERYGILSDLEDLEQSILHFTEAIFLPLPWDTRRCQNIIQIFKSIALALVLRAKESRRPEDVMRSIIYLRYLRGQSLEDFDIPPTRVTEYLMAALGIQVEMKLGDERKAIEEMADLCHELLRLDNSTTSEPDFIVAFIRAVFVQLEKRQEPSDKVIECLREMNVRLPDSHGISIALADSLYNRFRLAYSNDDYEEGTTILDKVIHSSGDTQTHHQTAMLSACLFAQARSQMFKKPEYLEEAIYRNRNLLSTISPEDPNYAIVAFGLAGHQASRFDDSGVANGLQEAGLSLRRSQVSDRPSFQDLTSSLTELNTDLWPYFKAILYIEGVADTAELEEAVGYFRLWVASSHHGTEFAHLAGKAFGDLLLRVFSRTNKIEYIDEAISVFRDIFTTQAVLPGAHFSVFQGLINSLFNRFIRLYRREDFNEIMQLYPMAANHKRAKTPDRFQLSCDWASVAHVSGHPSTSAAYDCAISLMQDTLTFAPTLDLQHSRVVAMRDHYENLPLNHASFHVGKGQLRRAIETLERGRALIWSEMRGFRTSIDQIRATDPQIADEFAEVNWKLEMLTLGISENSNDNSRDDNTMRMDPFGRLVVQQRKLLDGRIKLISKIQALPGLETFLKPPSFDELHSAATRGPVIIINHCKWRSDIVILLHNSPRTPSLIPTADNFYDRSNNLRDELLSARKEGLDSDQYEDALRSVLKELYELVGRPVIQRLNELGVPEQSRVWWCPTSVFCSLPLHAIGPIPSDDGPPQYFMDLYIPSYTPTLSTLIESNNSGSHVLEKPSILLISQPDVSLPGARGEMRVVKATNTQVTTLVSANATPTTVLEGLRDHRFTHIVCHGVLEAGKPFDASFKLYRDERLSLHDIVRSRLPKAEFAFLSACHTAELTEDSIADEALHLVAAMQYCGYRSVVGTMWAMADIDGRDLARNFYEQVFSVEAEGVRYYERTAEALRDAVRFLRGKKQMTLERWVNFVHYGA